MNKSKFIIIYGAIVTFVFFALFNWHMLPTFLVWFTLSYLLLKSQISEDEKMVVFSIAFFYPFFEFAIKLISTNYTFQSSWFWLNRIEHFVLSAFITSFFYLGAKNFKKLDEPIYLAIFSFGAINLLGVFNEIVEFIIRQVNFRNNLAYYSDTLLDLTINIGAAIIILFFLTFNDYRRIRSQK